MYDEDSDRLFAGARSRDIWIRGLLVLLFLAVLWFVRLVVLLLAAFQFVFAIVTGGPNQRLLPFCRSMATYMRQMAEFVTWAAETRPYPFSPWPNDETEFHDEPAAAARPAKSRDWDQPYEADVAQEAPPAEPVGDEPPAPPKPKSGGTKGKKKKKGAPRKPADTGAADDEPATG